MFKVPGTLSSPDFEGVFPARLDREHSHLLISAAVPNGLPARQSSAFLRSSVTSALAAAEAYLARKKLAIDTGPVRAFAEHVLRLLTDEPLSEDERYRELVAESSVNGPRGVFVELDAAAGELRRVEVYGDGRMDYAVRAIETGTTTLRRESATAAGRFIPEERFEELWQQAINQPEPRGPIRVVDYPAG